jgi:hypothetical protein
MTRTQIAAALRTSGEQAALADDAAAQAVQLAEQAAAQAAQGQSDANAAGAAVSRAELGEMPPGKRESARFGKLDEARRASVAAAARAAYDADESLAPAAAWRAALAESAEQAKAALAAERQSAKAAKAGTGPTLRDRAAVELPEGQPAPAGYELIKVTGGFLQFARSTATEGPAWLTQCTAHGSTTGAENRKAGRNAGSSSARASWCKGCKADAAKAAKAAAK